MCRVAAYVGPPAPLSTLLYDAPRSLEVQAYKPRQQQHGHVNVDGTGVVWWTDEAAPLRYVTERPPWSDPNLPVLAPRLRSGRQLAAVRSATPGMAYGTGGLAPFVHGDLAAVHNGWIGGFLERTRRPLMDRLPDRLLARYEGSSDSALLLLHVAHALARHPDAGLAAAVRRTAATVREVCAHHGEAATLTVLVADHERLVALRAAFGGPCNTLYMLRDAARYPAATLLASEPLDDEPDWRPVPEHTLLEITAEGVSETPVSLVDQPLEAST